MNLVFFALVIVAVVLGGATGTMGAVGKAAFAGATTSIELSISLAGAMALFLGLMKILEEAGGITLLSRAVRPVMVRLFPDVPADHPAMGAMILNIAANVLGLGNAATPFGIKAMVELETLNKRPGVATNAMVLFLAINTSGVAVFPKDVIALRAAAGAASPASVLVPTLVASAINTVFAVLAAKAFARLVDPEPGVHHPREERWTDLLFPAALLAAFGALVGVVARYGALASDWIIPCLIAGILAIGVARGVKIYEVFIEGAREGLTTALRIVPYLVAILSAVGMFRASSAMTWVETTLAPLARTIGMPPEVLPLAILRPLSGSGALALTGELTKTHGPDSFIAQVAGTMMGTTETTFYVLAVYFGAVGVTRARHAVPTGLVADLSGVIAAVAVCRWLLG
jgi:spore maturation protein SpmA